MKLKRGYASLLQVKVKVNMVILATLFVDIPMVSRAACLACVV